MFSKRTATFIRQLHQKKYRNEHKLFIVEGEKIVKELLTSNFTVHSLYAVEEWMTTTEVGNMQTHFFTVTEKELTTISLLETPNKVLAVVEQPPNSEEINLHDNFNYLLLDGIRDPGNLGTIIRICDWFGIDHIFLSADTVEYFNPKVVQASMGSIFRVNSQEVDLEKVFTANKKSTQLPVYGAVLNGSNAFKSKFQKAVMLLIGNESNGISKSLLKYIDTPVTIPLMSRIQGHAESLNAAIATALLCAEIRKQQE